MENETHVPHLSLCEHGLPAPCAVCRLRADIDAGALPIVSDVARGLPAMTPEEVERGEKELARNDAEYEQAQRYKEHGPALVRACALAAVMIPGPAGQAIADLIAKVEGR
jgi:hypothetical protein